MAGSRGCGRGCGAWKVPRGVVGAEGCALPELEQQEAKVLHRDEHVVLGPTQLGDLRPHVVEHLGRVRVSVRVRGGHRVRARVRARGRARVRSSTCSCSALGGGCAHMARPSVTYSAYRGKAASSASLIRSHLQPHVTGAATACARGLQPHVPGAATACKGLHVHVHVLEVVVRVRVGVRVRVRVKG